MHSSDHKWWFAFRETPWALGWFNLSRWYLSKWEMSKDYRTVPLCQPQIRSQWRFPLLVQLEARVPAPAIPAIALDVPLTSYFCLNFTPMIVRLFIFPHLLASWHRLAPWWWCAAAVWSDPSDFCSRRLCPQPSRSADRPAWCSREADGKIW